MMKESNRYGDYVFTEIGEPSNNVMHDTCPVSTVAHCVFMCQGSTRVELEYEDYPESVTYYYANGMQSCLFSNDVISVLIIR